MVRLKEEKVDDLLLFYPCFNSTMVRLKGIWDANRLYLRGQFQFHNGSIKSLMNLDVNDLVFKSFNSTMVRLKVDDVIERLDERLMFQFHNGSIKSVKGLRFLPSLD